eukprot:jgi/Orpsp1_1/1182434/evm.model.c7180000081255.1
METSNEANAVNILSWIFDELDTQKFGINNNKHFNYFDDSDENIQKINHFYLNFKPFDSSFDDKGINEDDVDNIKIENKEKKNNNGKSKTHPNQGESGDLKNLKKHQTHNRNENENNSDLHKDSKISSSLDSLNDKDEFKSKELNFELFNANISLNPEDNNQLIYNSKELRKFKSDYQIGLKRKNSSSSKKLTRSLSTSVLVPPISILINVKFTNFTKENPNQFFSSSNRSLFNSNILTNEPDILTDVFPDEKIEKNDDDDNILEESYIENKEELINNKKINNSIKNTNLILEKIMDSPANPNNDYVIDNTPENIEKEENESNLSSNTAVNSSVSNSNENIIKVSLESVMTNKNLRMAKDDLSLLEKSKSEKENESAYTLNEYGQSLFRLRYYLLQLKYLIDFNKELEQIIFYKIALSQYPDGNSVRTWLKRRITREPLVHGYCLPPFITNDETLTNDMFNRPLKNKIFHSLSLDKKYQVVEPLEYEFNRKVMGTSEHKSLVSCNSNLKYCQMKQRSDIVLRTIFIKHLFQQASDIKRIIGNERFQSLKDKALVNLQPRLSKHYKTDKNINNSMISIKLKTNKKKGIYLQHHSKKASYDFSSRNSRTTNNNLSLSPQPVDSINNSLHSSAYDKRFEKSKSYQNIFSSNSPSKLRNCHTLLEPTHKYSYSQPLTHIIFNKQNNQYSIEPLPTISSSQRIFTKEKSFFSKYIFSSNSNINNGNSYYNIHKSNSNMMMNNIGSGNNNNNNVIVITNMNSTNNVNNSNINMNSNNKNVRNNRNMVMSDMALNINKQASMNMNISSSNINNNLNTYGYRKHSHISSISSIKEITNNSNCYNIDNVKNSIETVSKAKLNIARNINSNSNIDHNINSYDISNSNRKLKDIQSEKSLNTFKDSDSSNEFNQSDIINNYSDQDSVYSLSSNYNYEKDNNHEINDNVIADSNRTLVVYKKDNKKGNFFKKMLVLMKSKKQIDKKKKSNKNNKDNGKNNKLDTNSRNILDSEETINNSMEISKSIPSVSISNSNFSMNMNSNYNSDETIHTNSRSIQNIKSVVVEKGEKNKSKKSSKWHIHLFNKTKTKVNN